MLFLLELVVAAEGAVEGPTGTHVEEAVDGAVGGRASSPAVGQHAGGSSLVGAVGAKAQEVGALGSDGELPLGRVRDRMGGALGRLPGAMMVTLWAAVECMCKAA